VEPKDLLDLRQYGFRAHHGWKVRLRTADHITRGQWWREWPDDTMDRHEPLVENVYNEALYDKAATAGGIKPSVEVAPVRGTRSDRGETSAQKRRRAFNSFLRDSNIEDKQVAWVMDWLQAGTMVGMPWKDWRHGSSHPYIIRIDPRHHYPLSHDSRDLLTSAFNLRYRKVFELRRDYGIDNEALRNLSGWAKMKNFDEPHTVEEIFYADDKMWGLAVVATERPTPDMFRYVDPLHQSTGAPFVDWLVPLHPHGLEGCPITEKRRRTADGEYRGALDDMIPTMRVANNLMARMLEMVDFQTGAPIGLDNVANPEDFVPGGLLRGTGEGDLRIVIPNFPVNFEAMQHARGAIDAARNVGRYPQQRAGDPGASVVSAAGIAQSIGAFNSELAWSQRDLGLFYRWLLERTANFDQVWCGGVRKEINGWDEGEMYTDTYDAGSFWKDDFRVEVIFERVGLEEHQHLTRLALMKNMGGISTRTLIRKSGMVENYLAEERDRDIEAVAMGLIGIINQQAMQGNPQPLVTFLDKMDDDSKSNREAIIETAREMGLIDTEGQVRGGTPGPEPNPLDAALRPGPSLEAGGIPGQAEGLPPARVGGALAGLLPPGAPRALQAAGGGGG